jgi:hypothetical protein
MMRIKGQAALEFLMTYGWAIIVSVIVLLAAWQMEVFNPGGNVKPTPTGFWGITPYDMYYKSDGTLTLALQNNVGGDVNITNINATTGLNTGSPGGWTTLPLSAGNITKINPIALTKYKAGSSFNVFVSIEYVDNRVGSGTPFISSGYIRGSVGS